MMSRAVIPPSLPILIVATALATHLGSGQALAQPAGLSPGDTYHLVFVTSTTTNVDSDRSVPPLGPTTWGGIPAADWVVTFHADTAGGGAASSYGISPLHFLSGNPNGSPWNFIDSHWRAILSDSGLATGCGGGTDTEGDQS